MDRKSLLKNIYATYVLLWMTTTSRRPIGKNVFEDDWDVLVILDACRVDALYEVSDEYEFLDEIEEVYSVGSTSKEWVEQTFVNEYVDEIRQTAYITGNPFSDVLLDRRDLREYIATNGTWVEQSSIAEKLISDSVVNIDDIGLMEPLWGSTEPGAGFHENQKPDTITEYTIKAGRSDEYNRVIAHYMQPHHPYFSTSTDINELTNIEEAPFEALRGDKKEEVWELYLDNLRYGLDWVETLIENVDGKVVITSDHGELMGEQHMYFHMVGNPHPTLRKVPWVEINASDENTFESNVSFDGSTSAQDVSEDQLKALGYL